MKKIIVLIWILFTINLFSENRYVDIKKYSEGVIAVKSNNGKYGYVDKTGKVVIPFKYDDAGEFHNGIALVYIKDGYTLIDKTGKIILGKRYASIERSSCGLRKVHDIETGKYGYINNNGEVTLSLIYDNATEFYNGTAIVMINNESFLINTIGNMKSKIYDYIYYYPSSYLVMEKNSKYGYINLDGEEKVPCIYDNASEEKNGVAVVVKDKNEYLIDMNGKVMFKFKSEYLFIEHGIYENIVLIWSDKNKKSGLIGYNGEIIMSPKYYIIGEFENNYAVVGNENREYGLIDKTGKEIIPLKYLDLISFGEDGFMYAEENEFGEKKYGLMDKNFKKITKAKYDYVGEYSNGYAVIIDNLTNGKCGLIDKTGKEYYIGKVKDFVTEE